MFKGFSLAANSKGRGGGSQIPPPNQTKNPPTRRDYFDNDDDDDDESPSLPSHSNLGPDDEDDPLDSFMATINQQAANDKVNIGKAARPEIVSNTEDYEYFNASTRTKGSSVPAAGQGEAAVADEDSDYDYEESEEIDDENGKKIRKVKIEPLPPIDHNTIQYASFRKCFYKEHSEVKAMSEEDIDKFLSDQEISTTVFQGSRSTTGSNVIIPRPIQQFHQAGFVFKLQQEIERQGLEKPTAIQSQALPIILSGYDLLALAKTGSGKTFAYVWPMIIHILDQPQMALGDGPIGLILAPTRELATQIYQETKRFGKVYNIRACPIYGGAGKWEMTKALKESPEIVVATPGRLIEMIRIKATNLRRCTMVVLDEADRMFEMGFEYQMRSIVNQIRPNRQMLMFSATMKKKIESFAKDMLSYNNDMIRLSIGNIGQANPDIQQCVDIVSNEEMKWLWLAERIDEFASEGKVLIFVLTKATADLLCSQLQSYLWKRQLDIGVDTLHGDKDQRERNSVMQRFAKTSSSALSASTLPSTEGSVGSSSSKKVVPCHILIATDIASRGLDVKDIRTVINYDVAKNIETYVHRIGRTGRMGVQGVTPGTAYTLLTAKESSFAVDLVQNLRLSSQPVSEELQRLASSDAKWSRIKHFGHGGRGNTGSNQKGGLGSNAYGAGFASKAMTSEMLARESFSQPSSSQGGNSKQQNNTFPPPPLPPSDQRKSTLTPSTISTGPILKGFVRASSSYHSVSQSESVASAPSNPRPPVANYAPPPLPNSHDPTNQVASSFETDISTTASTSVRKRTRWDT